MLLAYKVGEPGLPFTACPKVAEYSKEKPFSHSALRKLHPRAILAAAGAAMAFIDQHQIITLEGIDGDGLIAHLISKLVNVQDFDRVTSEQAASVLIEQFRLDILPSSNSRKCCWLRVPR